MRQGYSGVTTSLRGSLYLRGSARKVVALAQLYVINVRNMRNMSKHVLPTAYYKFDMVVFFDSMFDSHARSI